MVHVKLIETVYQEGVAKSIKALNHRGTKATKGKLFFVLFVPFVVHFFSGPFATTSFAGMTAVCASAPGGTREGMTKQEGSESDLRTLAQSCGKGQVGLRSR